jgi:hypothetical protein
LQNTHDSRGLTVLAMPGAAPCTPCSVRVPTATDFVDVFSGLQTCGRPGSRKNMPPFGHDRY